MYVLEVCFITLGGKSIESYFSVLFPCQIKWYSVGLTFLHIKQEKVIITGERLFDTVTPR